MTFLLSTSAALGTEYLQSQNTAPTSVRELDSPLDASLKKEKKEVHRIQLEEIKHRLKNYPGWIRDATLDLNLRTYDFSRVNQNERSDNKAWTLGGELGFVSGKIADIARVEVSYYYSGGLYAPEDKGNTGLLTVDQQNLSTIGKAYLLLGNEQHIAARLYRQVLDYPYLNKHDSRMIPNLHEGYLVGRKGTSLDFVAGQVTKMKPWDREDFEPMSVLAGAQGTDKGVTVAGLKGTPVKDVKLGAFNFYGQDTFNTLYAESNWVSPLLSKYDIKTKFQYTDQRSVGNELVGSFSTNSFGLGLAGGQSGRILRVAYTQTGKGGSARNPWGGLPLYNTMILQHFNRAGEKSLRVGFSLAGSNPDSRGWSGFANITHGWDALTAGTGTPQPDVTEYDITLDYKPGDKSSAADLWLRIRAAYADFNNDTNRWNLRIILNYPLHLL